MTERLTNARSGVPGFLARRYRDSPLKTKFTVVLCTSTLVFSAFVALLLGMLYAAEQRGGFEIAIQADASALGGIVSALPVGETSASTNALVAVVGAYRSAVHETLDVCLFSTLANYRFVFAAGSSFSVSTQQRGSPASVKILDRRSCSGTTGDRWTNGNFVSSRLVEDYRGEAVALLTLTASTADLDSRIANFSLFLVLATALATALSAIAAARLKAAILKPLFALQEVSQSILDTGEFNQRVAVSGRDEIGELVTIFNRMLGTIASEREKREAALHTLTRIAHFDGLTGLPNREASIAALQLAVEAARLSGADVAAVFIDLDNFKSINDSLGHEAGDTLLQEASRRLSTVMNTDTTLGRLGGDEFLVIVAPQQGAISDETLDALAAELIRQLSSVYTVASHVMSTRASIGIGRFPEHAQDAETLLKVADSAMYKAKEDGRDTWRFFDEGINKRNLRRHMIATDLRIALREQQMQVAYQPIVKVDTREIMGAEALLRWHHPQFRTIVPSEFIPVAESTGIIDQLGVWVIKESCRLLDRMKTEDGRLLHGKSDFRISINLSPVQFRQADLFVIIESILLEFGIPPARIRFEVTESIFMDELDSASLVLGKLRKIGCGVSIDDFGTGFSSLSYLSKLPVDTLKIDRSFVTELSSYHADAAKVDSATEQAQSIVLAILSLASRLNMRVVAEGVEHHDQLRFLKDHGCDAVQGYLFGKPMPEREFIEFIARKSQE